MTQLCELGSNRASFPGGVELEQLGDGSQPGKATQTCPLASNAVPHGSLPGVENSLKLLMLEAKDDCPRDRMDDPNAKIMLAATIERAAQKVRTFLVICFIYGLDS